MGFTCSHHDHAIFYLREGKSLLICAVYFDDMLLVGNDPALCDRIKATLS